MKRATIIAVLLLISMQAAAGEGQWSWHSNDDPMTGELQAVVSITITKQGAVQGDLNNSASLAFKAEGEGAFYLIYNPSEPVPGTTATLYVKVDSRQVLTYAAEDPTLKDLWMIATGDAADSFTVAGEMISGALVMVQLRSANMNHAIDTFHCLGLKAALQGASDHMGWGDGT